MPGFGLKSAAITVGTSATALGSGLARSDLLVMALAGNVGSVYVGGSDVSATNGILLSKTVPQKLPKVDTNGHTEDYNLAACFGIGTDSGDKVLILYAKPDSSAV